MFDAELVSRNFIYAGGKLALLITASPILAGMPIESVLSLAGVGRFSSQITQVIILYIGVLLAYSAISGTAVMEFSTA